MLVVGRHQQQPSAVGGTTAHYNDVGGVTQLLAIAQEFHAGHRAATGIGVQALHLSAGEQKHVGAAAQGRPHAADLRIPLRMHQAGEAIAVVATPAAAVGHVALIEHHAAGGMEGMQAGGAQIIGQLLDARFVADRRMRIGHRTGWIGGILTAQAMHVIHRLGLLIPGLEVAVAQRPGRRDTVVMFKRLKIALAQAEVMSAVHLGGATNEVMAARLERVALAVVPNIAREITALLEHLLRIPVLRFLRQPVAPFQDEDAQPRGGQHPRQGATAGAAADDQQIEVGGLRFLKLGRGEQSVHRTIADTGKLETADRSVRCLS